MITGKFEKITLKSSIKRLTTSYCNILQIEVTRMKLRFGYSNF